MKKYETIQELVDAVKKGEVDESALEVVQDNDCSSVFLRPSLEDGEDEPSNKIFEGGGHYDTDALWKALFPKANVYWC